MTQLIVAGLVALALVASIWKFGDHMADARELEVRAEYARAADEQKKIDEANQRTLREWALQLSKNYLRFGTQQETFFKGVGDGLAKEIASNPLLRRACFDAIGVSGFNRKPTVGEGGAGPTPGGGDGAVPGGTPPARR